MIRSPRLGTAVLGLAASMLLLNGVLASPPATPSPRMTSAASTSEPMPPPQADGWVGTLTPGQSLRDAAAGGNVLLHQKDGNVVVYNADDRPIWSTLTAGRQTSRLVMQPDGNFVLYDLSGQPIFHTRTHGTGATLTLQGDANLVLYAPEPHVKWAALHWPPKPPAPQIPAILRRIRGCESGTGPNSPGDYTAKNPKSTASGAYQFLDSTWRNTTGMAAPARAYSRETQDRAAIKLYNEQGTSPWNPSRHCWG